MYNQLESLARTDDDHENLSQWRDYFIDYYHANEEQREILLTQTDEWEEYANDRIEELIQIGHLESIDKYEKEHGEIIQYLKINEKSRFTTQLQQYETAFDYWKDSTTTELSDREGKYNRMMQKFDILKEHYHNSKRRKVIEKSRKKEYDALYAKYNDDWVLLHKWSKKGPDVNLLTRMQNAFNNYQHADAINRTAILPTIQQLGAQIQQRVQQ